MCIFCHCFCSILLTGVVNGAADDRRELIRLPVDSTSEQGAGLYVIKQGVRMQFRKLPHNSGNL